ncbi:MAG: GlsB/YeaQ/YmgE family stress response membrane protein [Ktedonobacterales bacterium]
MLHPLLAYVGPGWLELDPGGCLSWAFAGLIAGWLAGTVVRGRGFGCLGDIILGLIGAFVGALLVSLLPPWVAASLQLTGTLHFFGTLVVAFIGALVLAVLGRLIGGGRSRHHYADWPGSRYR